MAKPRRTLDSTIEPQGDAPRGSALAIPKMSDETRQFTGRADSSSNGKPASTARKPDAKVTPPEGKGISFLARPEDLYDWLQDAVNARRKKKLATSRQKDFLRLCLYEGLKKHHPELMPEGFDSDVILHPPD